MIRLRNRAAGDAGASGSQAAQPPGAGGGPDLVAARSDMLARQLRDRGVHDERVLAAMAAVARERFVPAWLLDRAYADEALPTAAGQTISQPLMVGLMTQLLAPEPGMHVLEVGAGSGYQAAVIAAMGCRVTGIERLPELVDSARERIAALGLADAVSIVLGDGSLGLAEGAPWKRILVSAAAPRVPASLVAQLAEGGRLVVPVGARHEQELLLVERRGDTPVTTRHGACVFVPLVGEDGWA